ncbi:hypothetical protein COCMIDRAFT_87152, partial [Bipolaris oryzae ATCC 44560]
PQLPKQSGDSGFHFTHSHTVYMTFIRCEVVSAIAPPFHYLCFSPHFVSVPDPSTLQLSQPTAKDKERTRVTQKFYFL